jgi:hypothetical protein
MNLVMTTKTCDRLSEIKNRPYVSLNNVFVVVFAFISTFFYLRYFFNVARVYK